MRRDFDKELKTALCYAMELEYAKSCAKGIGV